MSEGRGTFAESFTGNPLPGYGSSASLDDRRNIFPFFDLPRELRDWVYTCATDKVDSVWVVPEGKGRVQGSHALRGVCRQMDQEISEMIDRYATTGPDAVVCAVTDFDCRPVMQYLARVIRDPKAAIIDFTKDATRKRNIYLDLTITKSWCEDQDPEKLSAWLKWINKNIPKHIYLCPMYQFRHIEDREMTLKKLKGLGDDFGDENQLNRITRRYTAWYLNEQDRHAGLDLSVEGRDAQHMEIRYLEACEELKNYLVDYPGLASKLSSRP